MVLKLFAEVSRLGSQDSHSRHAASAAAMEASKQKSKSLGLLHKSETAIYSKSENDVFLVLFCFVFFIVVTPGEKVRELQANEPWHQQSRILERKLFRHDKIIFLFCSSFPRLIH